MPPRLRIQPRPQLLAYRPRPSSCLPQRAVLVQCPLQCRGFAEEQEPKGMGMGQAEHISEEAAKMSKIKGEEGPDLDQGTPVKEVVKGDKKLQDSLPEVMKDGTKKDAPKCSRSFSTISRRAMEVAPNELSLEAQASLPVAQTGHKFDLPTLPLPPQSHLHHRYDPVVDQVTKLIMRDGKLSVAQRNMDTILQHLRTSPAPKINPARPLLPNSPPASHLPLHPTLYLSLAIDSVAPLMRIRSQKGAAGGGVALQIPVPMSQRQRRRQAIMWILDAADKKKSGLSPFAKRVAEEIVAVVEGRSAVWERRSATHRQGVTARANLNFVMRRRR